MNCMNIFDVGIILFFVSCLILGFKSGIIKELVSLFGIILMFLVAFSSKQILGDLFCNYLPFFEFFGNIKGLTSLNILLYQLLGFLVIFLVLFIAYRILIKLSKIVQKLVNLTLILVLPSRVLGAITSFVKGYIIVFILIIVFIIPLSTIDMFNESKVVNYIMYKTPILSDYSENYIKISTDIYDLSNKILNNEIDKDSANKEILEHILEYKISGKDKIEELVNNNKLTGINNINSILAKY